MSRVPDSLPGKLSVREAIELPIPLIEVCDVGAMSEGVDRYSRLAAQGLARITGFEPNPAELAKLEARQDPGRHYLPYLLGRGGRATFHITRYPGCSSLYEPDPEVIDHFTSIGATLPDGNFAVVKTESVQTTRLDDIPGLPPFDYMKLDIQGAELDVLAGGSRSLATALVIEAEVEFVPLYKAQPLFGDVQCYLRERGYILHKFIDIAGRSFAPYIVNRNPYVPMSQLLWADAVFVRDIFHLTDWTEEQLLKAAAILYECYDSHDLVQYLLAEHDRRRQTTLVSHFSHTLRSAPNVQLQYMTQKTGP